MTTILLPLHHGEVESGLSCSYVDQPQVQLNWFFCSTKHPTRVTQQCSAHRLKWYGGFERASPLVQLLGWKAGLGPFFLSGCRLRPAQLPRAGSVSLERQEVELAHLSNSWAWRVALPPLPYSVGSNSHRILPSVKSWEHTVHISMGTLSRNGDSLTEDYRSELNYRGSHRTGHLLRLIHLDLFIEYLLCVRQCYRQDIAGNKTERSLPPWSSYARCLESEMVSNALDLAAWWVPCQDRGSPGGQFELEFDNITEN